MEMTETLKNRREQRQETETRGHAVGNVSVHTDSVWLRAGECVTVCVCFFMSLMSPSACVSRLQTLIFLNLLLPSVWVCLLCHVKLQTAWNQTSCLVSVILNREGSMRSFCLILAGTVVLAKCIPRGGLGCQCAVTYRVTLPHPGFHMGGNTACHVKGTRWWGQDASTE